MAFDDYGDDDDLNDYGMDQYYGEESDEDDSADMRHYMQQNYPPGTMFGA